MRRPKIHRIYFQTGGLVAVLMAAGFVTTATQDFFSIKYSNNVAQVVDAMPDSALANAGEKARTDTASQIIVTHVKTPDEVKAIYMSQCVVGTRDFRQRLVDVVDSTEINSLIIDIKDYTGKLAFSTNNPKISHAVSDKCGANDIVEFIDFLHKKGIYVIGRITVFQDPYMSKTHPEWAVKRLSDGQVWEDYKGLSFIDVGARGYWDYIVEISKESYAKGFDELNFDYIRFPSDGNMKDISYALIENKPKPVALEEFFTYLNDTLHREGIVTSADLFGMTTTNRDDLNIGQVLERALPHFDYIAPMVYPSHYPKNFNGWANPNTVPYELVNYVMASAVKRANDFDAAQHVALANPSVSSGEIDHVDSTAKDVVTDVTPAPLGTSYKKLRTWIQDFDYGGTYDIPEVKAQIKASRDAGVSSWMIWAPSNIYTVGALEKE